MSFVTTYILAPHRNDIENVGKLNHVIEEVYRIREHRIEGRPFHEMWRHFSRADAREFFAAHLNHFTPKRMCEALNQVEWDYPGQLWAMYRSENMEQWVPFLLDFDEKFISFPVNSAEKLEETE